MSSNDDSRFVADNSAHGRQVMKLMLLEALSPLLISLSVKE